MTKPEEIIVAATQNRHKIREIGQITSRFGMKIISRDEAGVPPVEIVEDGSSFEENSYKKAYEIMKLCGRPTIADDSGIEADCLGGAPGIYSARFAEMEGLPGAPGDPENLGAASDPADLGGASDPENLGAESDPADPDKANNRKLIRLISAFPEEERTGRFVSVITMVFPDGETISVRGTVEGKLLLEERGDGGFGYDPLFVPDGYDRTFGELPADLKNRISHRANALKKLEEELRRRG